MLPTQLILILGEIFQFEMIETISFFHKFSNRKLLFPFCILLSLVEANLHHIRTSFFSKKRFLNALKTSREGNLNSFLLLFLIFCLLSKQNDPTTSAKCARFKTKTLKAKKKKKYKNKSALSFLSKEAASH